MRLTGPSERPFYLFCLRQEAAEEIATFLTKAGIAAFVDPELADTPDRPLFRVGVPSHDYLLARHRLVEECPHFPIRGKFGDEPIFETTTGQRVGELPLGLFDDLRARGVTDHAVRESIVAFYLQADLHDRKRALEVLETFDEGREEIVVGLLAQTCRTDDEERLWELASFLVRIGPPSKLDPILEILSDPSVAVRRHAAMALGKIGNREVLPALISLYLDPSPEVQAEAADAVWRLTSTDDGFEPELSPEQKARIVQRWREDFSR